KPQLITSTEAYFHAVDALLTQGAELAETPGADTTLLPEVHAVETAQAEVNKTISAMSTAFLILGRDRVGSARSLMTSSSRSAVRFAQVIMSAAADPTEADSLSRHHQAIRESVTDAKQAAACARQRVRPHADRTVDTADPA